MAETDPDPSGDPQGDPNTPRELARARSDAKRHREDAERLRADIETMRRETDGLRGKLKQEQDAHVATKAESERAVKEASATAEKLIAEAKAERDRDVISAEIRAELVKAGARDPTKVARLIDASAVKRNEAGEIVGVADVVAAARKESEWMFGTSSTSSTAKTPDPGKQPDPKPATEWTPEEARAFERQHGLR